jgi:hypothetical protein
MMRHGCDVSAMQLKGQAPAMGRRPIAARHFVAWQAAENEMALRQQKIRFKPFLVGHFPKILPAIVVFGGAH